VPKRLSRLISCVGQFAIGAATGFVTWLVLVGVFCGGSSFLISKLAAGEHLDMESSISAAALEELGGSFGTSAMCLAAPILAWLFLRLLLLSPSASYGFALGVGACTIGAVSLPFWLSSVHLPARVPEVVRLTSLSAALAACVTAAMAAYIGLLLSKCRGGPNVMASEPGVAVKGE